eukprot:Nk52_evm1s1754 gene=Nk52_evmTU1s1754
MSHSGFSPSSLSSSLSNNTNSSSSGGGNSNKHWGSSIVVPIESSSSTSTQMESITKRVELFGGRKAGSWRLEAKLFYPKAPVPAKKLQAANVSVDDLKVLCVVNGRFLPLGATAQQAIMSPACVMTGDSLVAFDKADFESLLDRFKTMFLLKKTAKVEGSYYLFGDFIIKIGILFLGSLAKCPVVEIDYQSCANLSATQEMMKELLLNLVPSMEQFQVIGPINPTLPSMGTLTAMDSKSSASPSSPTTTTAGGRKRATGAGRTKGTR